MKKTFFLLLFSLAVGAAATAQNISRGENESAWMLQTKGEKIGDMDFLVPFFTFGQSRTPTSFLGKNLLELRAIRTANAENFEPSDLFTKPLFFEKKQLIFGKIIAANFLKKQKIPTAFCAGELPFFCRIEFKMDKKSSTPIRIRLGSAAYVDFLEGKKREIQW